VKHVNLIGATFLILTVGGSVTVSAQGRGRGRGRGEEEQNQVPAEEQQRRVQQEQQRTAQFRQRLDQQMQVMQRQNGELERQNRAAAYRAQQAYAAQLEQQRERMRAEREYEREPYISAPHTYRFIIAGRPRETNQFGVDILRQAVDYGYQQGYQAGRADRRDRWHSDYRSSPAYLDANYGYTGRYIDEEDYNYYFRQGFQRGYDDGFNSRYQYGSSVNGTAVILAAVAAAILGISLIH
jgi:hypothetical protein